MAELLKGIRVAELAALVLALLAALFATSKVLIFHAAMPLLVFGFIEALICYRHPELPKQPPRTALESLLASSSAHTDEKVTAHRSLLIAITLGSIIGAYVFLLVAGRLSL